jgi:hypothetical protein
VVHRQLFSWASVSSLALRVDRAIAQINIRPISIRFQSIREVFVEIVTQCRPQQGYVNVRERAAKIVLLWAAKVCVGRW